MKKAVIGILALVVVLGAVLLLWARSVLAGDAVRAAVESQLTRALGQPVSVGAAGASIFPRVTLVLSDVSIGNPARIRAERLAVGASLGALLSRRIEHASLQLDGARVDLPLPPFAIGGASSDADESSGAPVTLVSIDRIAIDDAQVTSGGRTIAATLEMVPAGDGMEIRQLTLTAGDERIDVTGTIANLSGPTGTLAVKADAIAFDQLLPFLSDFAGGTGLTSSGETTDTAPAVPDSSPMNLNVSIEAGRATFGGLALTGVKGQGHITPEAIAFETIDFGAFAGRYDGTLGLSLGSTPGFDIGATLAGVDMGQVMAFAGHPGLVTGTLSGRLDVHGSGLDAAAVLRTAQGTARVDLVDGVVKGLGLVRGIVLASSMRADSQGDVGSTSVDEPFTRLGATLAINGPVARTNDLRFESDNLLLTAAGTMALDGGPLDLAGKVQLSEALSAQAGRDLVRYTAEDGRVTLPVTVTGTATEPQVGVDLAGLARRAIQNKAEDEAKEAIEKGLRGLLGR